MSDSDESKPAGSGAAPWPGAGAFTDGLEMMKKLWTLPGAGGAPGGGLPFMQTMTGSVPSMFMPTMDVGELDKRIADLRSVEQWLNLNATMLRTTIQSLEVQRNTLAALQAFGGSMLATMATGATPAAAAGPAGADAGARGRARPRGAAKADSTPPPAAPDALNPALWWTELQDQFMRVAAAALNEAGARASGGEAAGAAPPESGAAQTAARDKAAGDPGRR